MQTVEIISFKHGGTRHRSWDKAIVKSQEPPVLFVPAHTSVRNPDGSIWSSPYDVEAYFHPRAWFNVFTLFKPEGTEWYCNVASPPMWDEHNGKISFVDYDLDVYVYADRTYRVLDRDEFELHAHLLTYPAAIIEQAEAGLGELIRQIEAGQGPFAAASLPAKFPNA